MMPSLFFNNRHFAPVHSATSQSLSQLAFRPARSGQEVNVVTSQHVCGNPIQLPAHEFLHGVTVHRVDSSPFGRARLHTRPIDSVSYCVATRRLPLKLAEADDIIITVRDPSLPSIVSAQIARRRGAHHVNWLQEVYPEIARALGTRFAKSRLYGLLCASRKASLRGADANVVVGQCMADWLQAADEPAERIHVIANWSDDERANPVAPKDNPLRNDWRLDKRFAVGYSGSPSRAYEFLTVLGAAKSLNDDTRIIFLFAGCGHRLADLKTRVKAIGLQDKFVFVPNQSEERPKFSLSIPHIHWISLRPESDGLAVPSKVYGAAAAGRLHHLRHIKE